MPSEQVNESHVRHRYKVLALVAAAVALVAVGLTAGATAVESTTIQATAAPTTTSTSPAVAEVGTLPPAPVPATVIPTLSPEQRRLVTTTTTADFHLANSGGVTDDSFMGAFRSFFTRYRLDERHEICDAMAARGWIPDSDMKRYGEGPYLDLARFTYAYRYACANWLHLPQLRPVNG